MSRLFTLEAALELNTQDFSRGVQTALDQGKSFAQVLSKTFQNLDLKSKAVDFVKEIPAMLEKAASQPGSELGASYLENVKELKENVESLLEIPGIMIGNFLLPTANKVVEAVNRMFPDENALGNQLSKVDAAFESNAKSIVANATKAETLVGVLEELSQKEKLNAQETATWTAAANELVEIYPSLKGHIGSAAGVFATSAEAIKAETSALKENALEKAKAAAAQEVIDKWAAAVVEAELAQAEYDRAYQSWQEADKKRIDFFTQYARGAGIAEEAISTFLQTRRMLDEPASQLVGIQPNQYNDLLNAELELSEIAYLRGKEVERLTENLATEEEAVKRVSEAFEELGYTGESYTTNLSMMTDNTESLTEQLEDLQKEAMSVVSLFDDLEKYKLDNFKKIKEQVEGVYGAFDKADKVRPTTNKKLQSNLDSQLEQLDRFQQAYDKLQESGASDELMSQFTFSTESIAQMEALLKAGPEAIAETEAKIADITTKQAEVAAAIAETKLKIDEEFSAMQKSAEDAATALQERNQQVTEDVENMKITVGEQGAEAETTLQNIQEAGEALGLSEWEPTINAEDNATAIINAVEKALNDLDGKRITTYIDVVQSGGDLPGHAVGFDYVPYDNYVARLHEGEAVLTKSEADRWRSGEGRGNQQQSEPINVTQYITVAKNEDFETGVKNAMEMLRWRG